MRRRRKFYRGSLNHIYQRAVNGFNIFYTDEDNLVFYTIFAVCVRSSDVVVLELCIMYNHFHMLIQTATAKKLAAFMDRFTSWFVREYNRFSGRTGQLFKKNFGSAPKSDPKKIRSCINYIGNNPVEKSICNNADMYKWGFLSYARSTRPFSDPLILSSSSLQMRKAIKEIDEMVRLNLPLKYMQLRRIFFKLTPTEKMQVIDYIITEYSPFDYDALVSFYGKYEDMIMAMDSNTGGEYDLKEDYDADSDVAYVEMCSYLIRKMGKDFSCKIIALPIEEKIKLFNELQQKTSATARQICRFLHIKPQKQ